VRWRILAVLGALSVSSYLLRGNLSIAAPSMIADLGIDQGIHNALLLAALAEHFGWTLAIAVGVAFALAGAGLNLLVRADRTVEQPG